MTSHEVSEPGLPVHAVLAAAACALPVPLLGQALGRAARGSGLRRVLRRRGLRFGPGARRELSAFRVGSAAPGVGSLLTRLPGVGVARRVQEGVATWVAARLVDRHLAATDHDLVLDVDEARRLRLALDHCFEDGLGAELLRLVAELTRLSGRTLGAPFRDDLEGRPPHLRAVDTLLDGLADLPAERFAALERRFDAALGPPPEAESRTESPR